MEARKRTCLRCNKLFDSAHAGNRICQRCSQINGRIHITEEELQKQRGAKRRNGMVIRDVEEDAVKIWGGQAIK